MRTIIIVLSIFLFHSVHAQVTRPSIVRVDTIPSKQDVEVLQIKEEFIPVPKKALLYSLVLPGAGQIYNRKLWKLPLVYGAYSGLIYAFDFNGEQYKRLKQAYEYRVDGDITTDPDTLIDPRVSNDALKRARDNTRKNLELTYMAAIVVHALNGIEAFVDAHLRNFDISEDLSFNIRPTFESSSVGVQSGVGLFVTF